MDISLRGNSGCELVIDDSGTVPRILKYSASESYNDRLKKQIQKQQTFATELNLPFIKVPKVLEESTKAKQYNFAMEFFSSYDFALFFQQANKADIELVTQYICQYIDAVTVLCTTTTIPKTIILEKYEQVKRNSFESKILDQVWLQELFRDVEKKFSNLPAGLELPIGRCHGDLTFSNILFNRKSKTLVFIDFLDSFIETPLQDMVKLRQDTLFQWSFLMYTKNFDVTKVEIVLEYMDKTLDTYFQKYPFYTAYYSYFQIMNFLRILPYAKEEKVIAYLRFVLSQKLL